MKTSNKLLIALASALIMLPIISIAIYSKLNYVKVVVEYEKNHKTFEKLDVPSLGYISNVFDENFNAITIKADKNVRLLLVVVESDETGIKFSNHLKNYFESTFDKNGELVITFKKVDYSDTDVFYIYATKVKKITTENMISVQLGMKADSLELVLKNSGKFNINSTFDVQNLSIIATSTEVNFLKNSEFNLNVILNDAKFLSTQTSYKKLSIVSKGVSFIQIGKSQSKDENVNIKEFNLNTFGPGSINLSDLNINQITGKLSDETMIVAPYRFIKNLK